MVRTRPRQPVLWFTLLAAAMLAFSGCAREHYHLAADRGAYEVLQEKSAAKPWHLPPAYSINPAPESRLFDPSPPDDPMLPHPGPDLYAYQLPPLTSRAEASRDPQTSPTELGAIGSDGEQSDRLQLASVSYDTGQIELVTPADAVDSNITGLANQDADRQALPYAEEDDDLTIQPIPKEYWEALPKECMLRMLEFESVREEYRRTYGEEPPESLRDPSPKLAFEDIVELAYLNSREYQTQKEALYSAALALTLERYDYMTKFTNFGNGGSVNYDYARTNGVSARTLSTPSFLGGERMVALGGTLIADFANNVVLTFNGPSGFAEQINSSLLFDFTQSVFQRDVLLEPLNLSERRVVYAARDFTRYRKQFFLDLAQTYYQELLGTYRRIEIDTQNYFAFVRALDQAEAEVRSGIGNAQPRFQIDQIEQNMLEGRSRLISTCNGLETRLDQLKLFLGLPTETPVNVDLSELEVLTLRDELEVVGELTRRARRRLSRQLEGGILDREEIVSSYVVLLDRMLEWLELRARVRGDVAADSASLRLSRARFRVDEAYEALDRVTSQLAAMKQAQPPTAPISVFRGTMAVVLADLELMARQLQLADALPQVPQQRDEVLQGFITLRARAEAVRERVATFLRGEGEDLAALQLEANTLLTQLEALRIPARIMTGAPQARPDRQQELQEAVQQAGELLATTEELLTNAEGLAVVDLSVDDAMVTALVQRFDLMNERGVLADRWRAVKLAADDLKSVMNLGVSHRFGHFDDETSGSHVDRTSTQVRANLDLPLNRRQQRNRYRQSLIDYQRGKRNVSALEDAIKFAARQDLRTLRLAKTQYDISVISAALASERVYSTQLELSLGLVSVTARDFLEAQQAYRSSLTSVANGRLGYIVDRARLAFDLEVMLLDDSGFWPELNNEDYSPEFDPIFPLNAGPTYGELPGAVWPSKQIKRMLHAPAPGYRVLGVEEISTEAIDPPLEAIPVPAPD